MFITPIRHVLEIWCFLASTTSVAGQSIAATLVDPPPVSNPFGVTIMGDALLYVADTMNHQVLRYNMEIGNTSTNPMRIAGDGDEGSELWELDQPKSVVVRPNGDVLVADSDNDRVVMWRVGSTEGELVIDAVDGEKLEKPMGMHLYGDILYVADRFKNRVVRVDLASGLSSVAFEGHRGLNLTLDRPHDVWATADGLYIADTFHHRIVFVKIAHHQTRKLSATESTSSEESTSARTQEVETRVEARVVAGNPSGIPGTWFDMDRLNTPQGIAMINDTLIIADTLNNRVMQWNLGDTAGTVIAGGMESGPKLTQLAKPKGVAPHKGLIYVCDTENNRLVTVPFLPPLPPTTRPPAPPGPGPSPIAFAYGITPLLWALMTL
eukprot:GEMP01027933.1.p1 GENE.GEMP01027933.1~~GEMP01027933.1.p1  ORF type:complete len:380 (+),score=83.25 GEMP01027933.1:215-1354(+)